MDHWQAVFQRDIQKPHDLFDGMGIPCPALDARIVGMNGDLAALHDADARHNGGAGHRAVIFAASREGGKLQKRCAGVKQQLQPLAHA